MPLNKLEEEISCQLDELKEEGTLKGEELVITEINEKEGRAPRYSIESKEGEFLKMNSNSYLGLHLHEDVVKAEEEASEKYGAGPGAVRFIHGTYKSHRKLEKRLADFHRRESCIIYSSAYSAMCGIIRPLTSDETLILSDELNHNCIINGIRMAKPKGKDIYPHLDMDGLEEKLQAAVGNYSRVMVITDGVFSMRGDYVDLDELVGLAEKYDSEFEEGVFTVMDDSHGIGAYGETGRGTTEITGVNMTVNLVSLDQPMTADGALTWNGEQVDLDLVVTSCQSRSFKGADVCFFVFTVSRSRYLLQAGLFPVLVQRDQ